MGNLASDRKNARTYSLKFSKNTDADIIQHLEGIENIQGYIKTLIRADMKGEPTMKRISIDNGHSFVTPEEAVKAMPWETIVNLMDDETREAVNAEWIDSEVEFLTRYLELAPDDLIVG